MDINSIPGLPELWEGIKYTHHFLSDTEFKVGKQNISLLSMLNGLLVVIVSVQIAFSLAKRLEKRLLGIERLDHNLRMLLVRLAKAVLLVIAVLISLTAVGIDLTALSVFTGALGVGLGFGLQRIASSYVSGFIILLDRSIQLGNVVQVDANTSGVVSEITTRYTVLRSLGGVKFIVPNETLVSTIIQNQSFSNPEVRATTHVSVAYNTDMDRVLALLKDIALAHPRVLSEPAPRAMIQNFGDSGIDIELGFWIADPEAGVGGIKADINLEIWRQFRDLGIEIPFPQREIRMLAGHVVP